ncbi:MAG: hypothetical protein ONB44_02845 [candidate division KSB1 bacterium]|nr:hypothetical protein [candidate division KSB1 bacterium]MDZ7301063.1 hypothetical protein [candidate division KSB1 bacterium]MDZ7312113.1 hypothetical protein [candidate division KSB1 bacterium]
MKDILKEFAKHYLGIGAAILIALLIGIFFKEPRLGTGSVIAGALTYALFLAIAVLFFQKSRKFNKEE